jgi:hypothetical protein
MKRHTSTALPSTRSDGSPHLSKTASTPASSASNFNAGFDASRALFGQGLAAAQTLLAQMAQRQRLRQSAIGGWTRLLASAQHDAEQAQDAQALTAVSSNFVTSQWALVMEQMGAQMSQWQENQIQWRDQMRTGGTQLAKRWLPQTLGQISAPSATANSDAEPPTAPALAPLGQLQDQWLAATQRWIDVTQSAQTH